MTGEIKRWDNSQLELIKRINQFDADPNNTFIYAVPLIIESNKDMGNK